MNSVACYMFRPPVVAVFWELLFAGPVTHLVKVMYFKTVKPYTAIRPWMVSPYTQRINRNSTQKFYQYLMF
jgi:hypothetical protein